LTWKLIPKIDDALKAEVVKWSAFYEHRIRLGSVSLVRSPLRGSVPDLYTESHLPSGGVCRKIHADCREVRLPLDDYRRASADRHVYSYLMGMGF